MMDNRIYQDLIRNELSGLYGTSVLEEMDEIIRYYALYDGKRDGEGKDLTRTNWIKKLINDESRHMCARAPELRFIPRNDADKAAAEELTQWLKDALDANGWSEQLLKGVRDAFIGKRVALKLSYESGKGVALRFAPSLEFIYSPDDRDTRKVDKAVFFYGTSPETITDKARQRYWKQRYRMKGNRCYLDEGEFDGYGRPVKIVCRDHDTGLDFAPVYVVVNGGLSGDLLGESDVRELIGNQRAYDRIKSDDLDALGYQMFGQKVFTDATEESVKSIVIEPNAMIDLQTEPTSPHQAKAQVPDLLTGLGASGKAMRALYWSLTSRCEERWATGWDTMLIWMAEAMLKIARLHGEKLPQIEYTLKIEHLYPIIDDEEDERAQDLTEVAQQARSRQSYIAKWQPDVKADAELAQIRKEKAMLEDSFTADAGRAW